MVSNLTDRAKPPDIACECCTRTTPKGRSRWGVEMCQRCMDLTARHLGPIRLGVATIIEVPVEHIGMRHAQNLIDLYHERIVRFMKEYT